MPLPKEGTPEWNSEIKFYLWADKEDIRKRAKQIGMQYNSYISRMIERGIKRQRGQPPILLDGREKFEVHLPPINLIDWKPSKEHKIDGEIAILHCSDGHAAKITKSFNKEIYKDRMYKMFESTMKIINLHRNMYPIKTLRIINTGDNCQGENIHQGSVVGSVEMGSRDQVTKLAAPVWNDIIGSFKQQFEVVIFDGVPGNHGAEKLAPITSKLDLQLYDVLKAGIGQHKGITINVHEDFSDIIEINGFRFFIFHGEQIPCMQGVPFFALDKKLKAWFIQYKGFNYALGGHFHKRHTDEVASRFEYFMSGSLVSDDEWALQKLGISSTPSQWLLGCHYRYGVTYRYALTVDDKFLPEPYNSSFII